MLKTNQYINLINNISNSINTWGYCMRLGLIILIVKLVHTTI